MFYLKKRGRRWNMKIADVVRWLMSQTEFKWVDYEKSSRSDKLLYHLDDDVAH
jgi:hypothetical protein